MNHNKNLVQNTMLLLISKKRELKRKGLAERRKDFSKHVFQSVVCF